jgi:cell division protein FtsL
MAQPLRAVRAERPVAAPSPAPSAKQRNKPRLVEVAPRRRTAGVIGAMVVALFALMIGALAFQTQVARTQLRLDTLDREIRQAHERYDVLRRERAELRSPGRLAQAAMALDMVPATQTEFVRIDADVVATVQRSGVGSQQSGLTDVEQEFRDYAAVKAQAGGKP